jgi:hypothetical protein
MLTKIQSRIEPRLWARVDPSHPLARGLAAGWLLNEAAGRTARDASGHRNHGAFSGGPVWSVGPSGHAIEFDGVDDWISMGNCLNLGTDDVTVLAMVRYSAALQPDAWSGTRIGAIAGKGYADGAGKGYGLFVFTNNEIYWQIRNQATNLNAVSDAPLNDGLWHLVIGVCDRDDAAGLRLYVDGRQQSMVINPTALNGIALTGSRSFAIGSRQDESTGGWFWDFAGSVAMVCVWKRVLTELEIRDLQRDPFRCFVSRSAIVVPALPAGTAVSCAGSIEAVASVSAAIRVARRLAGSITASASVGGALRVVRPAVVPATGRRTEVAWQREALLHGATRAAFMLGTSLTQGWFWVRRAGCAAVYRGDGITRMDLGRMLYVVEPDAKEITLPAYLSHAPGSAHCYLLRRFDSCGRQEKTSSAAVVVRIGPDGQLAAGRPNAVISLRSEQTAGACVRLVWLYCPLDQQDAPRQFNVYWNGGAGDVDLEHPIATIPYEGRKFYCHQSGPLADGRYTFIVRGVAADGAEGPPSVPLVHQITTAPPESAVILAAGCA